MSQLRFQIGTSQRPSWRSCSIRKWDSLKESSKSFEAVILTWKLFSYQKANSVKVSQNWRSTAASPSWTCGSTLGSSRSQPHHQWRLKTQASSVARGAQVQLKVQPSSRSVQADSPSVEFKSCQWTWFGHSRVPQVQSIILWVSLVSCQSHYHCLLSNGQLSAHHEARSISVVASATKGACQESAHTLPHGSRSQKGGCLSSTQNHHHAVSLAVIVMCLMLKCMQTSKVQIQAHTLVWSVSFLVFLVLVMFTFSGHLVISFDIFLSFFVSFGVFPDVSGIFPMLGRPISSTYEEQSWKGSRHNPDLSRKKWETPPRLETPSLSQNLGLSKKGLFGSCSGRAKRPKCDNLRLQSAVRILVGWGPQSDLCFPRTDTRSISGWFFAIRYAIAIANLSLCPKYLVRFESSTRVGFRSFLDAGISKLRNSANQGIWSAIEIAWVQKRPRSELSDLAIGCDRATAKK